jgi:hypothetical protein
MLEVVAETAKEAAKKAEETVGTYSYDCIGADVNNGFTIDAVRLGPVKKLTDKDLGWMGGYGRGGIDNDHGVPFEDYGPPGFVRDTRYERHPSSGR